MDNQIITEPIETNIELNLLSDEKMALFCRYLDDPNVINVGWTGSDFWVEYSNFKKVHIPYSEHGITPEYVNTFATHIRNSKQQGRFSKEAPLLEAETEKYRIECLHESVCASGTVIVMRKLTATPKLDYDTIINNHYCSEEILNFLINCCYAKKRIVIGGEPGVGKTELGKFLSLYIPNNERVVTIEDTYEWHYRKIKPQGDGIELRVNNNFTYDDALKSCLRLDTSRVVLSEVRGPEVEELIKLWNSGLSGITTIHTDDTRKIPDRILSMMPSREDAERLENVVYENLDVGILINKRYKENLDNIFFDRWERYIDQVCLFGRENGINKEYLIVENGKLNTRILPDKYKDTKKRYKLDDMFVLGERVKRSGNFE